MMTVNELISTLSKYQGDLEVMIADSDLGNIELYHVDQQEDHDGGDSYIELG